MRRPILLMIAATATLALIAMGYGLWVWHKANQPVDDWRHGELVVILPPEGSLDRAFDQHLAELFAAQLGATLKPLTGFPHQVPALLAQHLAHFSAIGLRSNEDQAPLKSGTPYQSLHEKVICRGKPPKSVEDLAGRSLVVIASSAEEAALRAAKQEQPALHWTTLARKLPNDLLDDVGHGRIDCTVANEEQIATMRNFHPDLSGSFDIAPPSRLAWAFAPDADLELWQQMQAFFVNIRQDGTLHRLLEQHYGYNERLVPVDAAAFLTHIRTLLPHYRQLFDEAATLTGIEWQWLAAMAYRESHWDPLATSPTGVRGMMMLTEDTADEMGVENRLDARESVIAGARYLRQLKDQLPLHVHEPDRTWLALAAYNQGRGHLEDARILAQRHNLNPDSWVDVKKVMPQLSNPDIEEQFKYGSARGGEAVIYVETVRLYHEMLQRQFREIPPPPTLLARITDKAGAKVLGLGLKLP